MSLVRLLTGDCRDVLADMDSNSLDGCVTDPPYALEFMGKDWDAPWKEDDDWQSGAGFAAPGIGDRKTAWPSFGGSTANPTCETCGGRKRGAKKCTCAAPVWKVKGQAINAQAQDLVNMQAFAGWVSEWGAELYRVLKPGAFAFVFGGTRTFEWMALGMAMAGFERRDTIMGWGYACLTDDVEVLTRTGWKRGVDVKIGDEIAQWDPATEAISIAAVSDTFRGPWCGDMVVLRNGDTDQVLTPNHRVFFQAHTNYSTNGVVRGDWSRWKVETADKVAARKKVRLPTGGFHDGPGVGGTDWAALLGWVWSEGGFDNSGTGVRITQSSVNQGYCDEIAALMDRIGSHKRYDRTRSYKGRQYVESTWFFSGDLAMAVRAAMPGKHPTYQLLWAMSQAEKEAFLDASLKGDGTRQRQSGSWTLFQNHREDCEWFATLLSLCGKRGHISERSGERAGQMSVGVSPRPQTQLSPKMLSRPSEHYEGDVWCVSVPTGAFVARRKDKIFITGNSGFPKSLNIETAVASIDPDRAAEWVGFGTALKPAVEPILVFRKPPESTVAVCVLAHGCGGLNIDAGRIPVGGVRPGRVAGVNPEVTGNVYRSGMGAGSAAVDATGEGRWPANLMLGHHPDCRQTGVRDVRSNSQTAERQTGPSTPAWDGLWKSKAGSGHGVDGVETVDVFDCVPGCPVADLDAQDPAGAISRFFHRTVWDPTLDVAPIVFCAKPSTFERDAGMPVGDRNEHVTVKPVGMMRQLVRLACPPGGTIIDPFSGSGTTLVAATVEGVSCVGIEKNPKYVEIIEHRVRLAERVGRLPAAVDYVDAVRPIVTADGGGQLDMFASAS